MRHGALLPACLAVACASSTDARSPVPEVAVSFRAVDLEGNSVTFGEFRDKVVLLTVINTWADPALYEVPFFKNLHRKYRDRGFEVICVALDDTPDTVEVFRDTFGVPYPVIMVEDRAHFVGENGPVGRISIVPSSYLVTRDGEIALRMEGTWNPDVLVAAIERLLAADPNND